MTGNMMFAIIFYLSIRSASTHADAIRKQAICMTAKISRCTPASAKTARSFTNVSLAQHARLS